MTLLNRVDHWHARPAFVGGAALGFAIAFPVAWLAPPWASWLLLVPIVMAFITGSTTRWVR